MQTSPDYQHGVQVLASGRARFRVWAPRAREIALRAVSPERFTAAMELGANGYWEATLENLPRATQYLFRIDGHLERPDPASRLQPEGVHGPSQVEDSAFAWEDHDWRGLSLEQCVLYELHVGAFTRQGTFDAIVPHLAYLRDLGVTFLELMPVVQFPGARNWGYDGVYPFAVQHSYGGPAGLKRLVNECHRAGLGVVLDVVYNHLGPEGNYLSAYGPYFTEAYRTPWGTALNFDGQDSDEVRRFFIENALYWIRDFHVDALRLDAVHGIFDRSAYPFLEELSDAVHQEAQRLDRKVYLMPESDLNDPRLIRSKERGGFAMDAQWADGFHHSLRVLLTGDRDGYYQDYGCVADLAKAYREGYVFTGQYSRFRRRRYGAPADDIPAHRFIVFSQNHDQVGNRMRGERLGNLVEFEGLKLAAAAVILSPHIPLLFMGEEYAEPAPFLYFIDHSDPDLVEAVRRGRAEEFSAFVAQGTPPDPQAEQSFLSSKLNPALRDKGRHQALLSYYQTLLRLRRSVAPLASMDKDALSIAFDEELLTMQVSRRLGEEEAMLVLCFAKQATRLRLPLRIGQWQTLLCSADPQWLGSGVPFPPLIDSEGEVEISFEPRSANLFRRLPEA